jgi:hypothetical protein
VTRRSDRLLSEIDSGALDHQTSIGDLLRKVVAPGGRAGSTELRDWATRELRGYGSDDELPEYRKLTAPLQYDMINTSWHITGRSLSTWEVPEFAREKINNDLHLRVGIGEIENLARKASSDGDVKLQPPGAPDLVAYMNRQKNLNGHLELIYWSVPLHPLKALWIRCARRPQ